MSATKPAMRGASPAWPSIAAVTPSTARTVRSAQASPAKRSAAVRVVAASAAMRILVELALEDTRSAM